ncbi:MAG: hypothetical protein WAU11_06305 [Ignavibacteriaceae bacterium]
MLKWIKKYKELLTIVGIIFSAMAGSILGDGVLWRNQENEREQTKLLFEKYTVSSNVSTQIENLYQQLFSLNEDYIIKTQSSALTKKDSIMFVQKLEYILDRFDSYESNLASLENRDVREMRRPYPLRELILVRTPKFLKIEYKPTPFYLFENSTFSILAFCISLVTYSAILMFYTRYLVKRKNRQI